VIIAERLLKLRLPSGGIAPAPVKIYCPRPDENAWACRWEIHWPDRLRTSDIFGYDSAQALLHALQAIGSDLYASEAHKSGSLFWTDADSGYGFPVPHIIRDELTGDDAKYL
jgi:hypothetical protein